MKSNGTATIEVQQGFAWTLGPKILDRYVAREFLFSYVVALLVVLSLRILLDLFLEFDEFVEARVGQAAPGALTVLGYILEYYGPKIFEFFRDFSGAIIILAAAFSLARMTRQNELTAMLASGMSLKRIIAPIVLLGFLLNLLLVVDQEFILPRLADKLTRRSDEMGQGQLRTVALWLQPDREGALVSAGEFNPNTRSLTDVTIICRRRGRAVGKITAERAQWDEQKQLWRLEKGLEISAESAGRSNQTKAATEYPSDLTPEYLWLQRNSNYKSLMSSADLSGLMQRPLKTGDLAEVLSEKHFRFTDPIINMVMLLLGLPLLVSRERKSTKTTMLLALLGAGGCFVVTFACKLLVGEDLFPGLFVGGDFQYKLLAWIPIIIFTPLSVLALDSIKT
ncbi:MAG: hypothetical protein AMJ79_07705 [Phycisphaerae bacterium SM23_30]|nr:MAG: hypothetical protein AMJ79_07705 [Phycisphaerae bacterium SM23_30]